MEPSSGVPPQALPEIAFERADESDDAEFYRIARLVTHIDEATIRALTQFYAEARSSPSVFPCSRSGL